MKKLKVELSKLRVTESFQCNLADDCTILPNQLSLEHVTSGSSSTSPYILSGFASKITGELFALDQELVFCCPTDKENIYIEELECVCAYGTIKFKNLHLKSLGDPIRHTQLLKAFSGDTHENSS